MESPAQHALRIYEEHEGDFSYALKWHLTHGVVVSLPDAFLLGFWCRKDKPRQHVPYAVADCIHVTMCVGSMRSAVARLVSMAPWLAYQRELKGDSRVRVCSFEKLYNKIR